jgi:hypothetical protein
LLPFLSHTELPKPGDKDILPVFKSLLQVFQKRVNQLGGAIIGEAAMVMDGFGDMGLGEGHPRSPVSLKRLALSPYSVNGNLNKSQKMME